MTTRLGDWFTYRWHRGECQNGHRLAQLVKSRSQVAGPRYPVRSSSALAALLWCERRVVPVDLSRSATFV